MILSCGCENVTDEASGVTKCIGKCQYHVDFKNNDPMDKDHYERIGVVRDGVPHCAGHIKELRDGLRLAGAALPRNIGGTVIEIGGGASMYCPEFLSLGYSYFGVEPSEWGSAWTRSAFNVPVFRGVWEDFQAQHPVDLIFSAHCFEHIPDSPAALHKVYDSLKPGGHLCLVLPDDTDQTNPGHFWFYTPDTLRALLLAIGFKDIAISVVKVVPHENFIYCLARKP